jgi:hypothetical protein
MPGLAEMRRTGRYKFNGICTFEDDDRGMPFAVGLTTWLLNMTKARDLAFTVFFRRTCGRMFLRLILRLCCAASGELLI